MSKVTKCEISNSRHIRDVSSQVKTVTRNLKMAALLAFVAYMQFMKSVMCVCIRNSTVCLSTDAQKACGHVCGWVRVCTSLEDCSIWVILITARDHKGQQVHSLFYKHTLVVPCDLSRSLIAFDIVSALPCGI